MSTTTFGQFDVVAYDWIESEEDPLIKIVKGPDDERVLEIVVGGGVMYLWPAEEIAQRINAAVFPSKQEGEGIQAESNNPSQEQG